MKPIAERFYTNYNRPINEHVQQYINQSNTSIHTYQNPSRQTFTKTYNQSLSFQKPKATRISSFHQFSLNSYNRLATIHDQRARTICFSTILQVIKREKRLETNESNTEQRPNKDHVLQTRNLQASTTSKRRFPASSTIHNRRIVEKPKKNEDKMNKMASNS